MIAGSWPVTLDVFPSIIPSATAGCHDERVWAKVMVENCPHRCSNRLRVHGAGMKHEDASALKKSNNREHRTRKRAGTSETLDAVQNCIGEFVLARNSILHKEYLARVCIAATRYFGRFTPTMGNVRCFFRCKKKWRKTLRRAREPSGLSGAGENRVFRVVKCPRAFSQGLPSHSSARISCAIFG